MASIYQLKSRFQDRLRPLCRALAGAGVTANQVTLAALGLSLAAGAALLLWPGAPGPLLALPAVLFIRMGLNAIDGMLAREHGQKSRLGALLNELGDVVSDAALYLPLALAPGVPAMPLVLAVLLAGLTEFAGVAALMVGAARRYDGPMGKSDRAFAFGLLALLLGIHVPVAPWLGPALWLMVLALVLTCLNRCRQALAEGAA